MADIDTGLNAWQMTSNHNYSAEQVRSNNRAVHFFGDHVAFDKKQWLEQGKLAQE